MLQKRGPKLTAPVYAFKTSPPTGYTENNYKFAVFDSRPEAKKGRIRLHNLNQTMFIQTYFVYQCSFTKMIDSHTRQCQMEFKWTYIIIFVFVICKYYLLIFQFIFFSISFAVD